MEGLVENKGVKAFLEEAYGGKPVLVTGHTGFKGAWLSMWLKQLGAEVVGYSLDPPTTPSLFEACDLRQRLTHIHGDIRDLPHLRQVIEQHRPEFIFHLAAQPIVRRSYLEPLLTYETNVMGTVNVLDAARRTPSPRAIIVVTSDKCYENKGTGTPFCESDPLGGCDPYSSSKGAAELATAAYRHSFFNPAAYREHGVALSSVRAGNIIGGGDWGEDRLIPDCVRALAQEKPVEIRNPEAVRPWQYVLDALYGYLLLGVRMLEDGSRFSAAWNFGPFGSGKVTVMQLVEKVVRYWGKQTIHPVASALQSRASLPYEATMLALDCTKAVTALKWKPIFSLEQALKETVSWYHFFYTGADQQEVYAKTRLQIGRWEQLAHHALQPAAC